MKVGNVVTENIVGRMLEHEISWKLVAALVEANLQDKMREM